MRASSKIALSFSILAIIFWAGYKLYPTWKLHSFEPKSLVPGHLNFISFSENAPFQMISSNHTISIINHPKKNQTQTYQHQKKIPLKEVIETLQRHPKALERLAMFFMHQDESKMPFQQIIWDIPSLHQALSGHPLLTQRLENDLNVKLDGTPLPYIRKSAYENGIVIKIPLSITIHSASGNQTLNSFISEPYKPNLIKNLEKKLGQHLIITPQILKKTYQSFFPDTSKRENVKRSLQHRISSDRVQHLSSTIENF